MHPNAAAPDTVVRLAGETDFEGWRAAARRLAAAGTPPERVSWLVGDGQRGLFDGEAEAAAAEVPADAGEGGDGAAPGLMVPLRFVLLARRAVLHTDPARFAVLHRLLHRITVGGQRHLLDRTVDPDVDRLLSMARAVDRAAHRMKAFLRFREVWTAQGPRHLAWFEPEHRVLSLAAPFLAERFAAMRWAVVTPDASAAWDGSTVAYGPGGRRSDVPAGDALDEDWRAYYAHVFNPARVNPGLMRQHMPKRYWRDMPETRGVRELVAAAPARAAAMVAAAPTEPARKGRVVALPHPRHRPAAPAVPRERPATLAAARELAAGCRACPLWEPATRTVFGEGPADARVMLVGEQPGDWEDLEGRPFVGPAGQLLDRALQEAGIGRGALYLTNAVKHFRFRTTGKRRLHQKPDAGHVEACGSWLGIERELVRPRLVVALGATAASALLGRAVRIREERGRALPLPGGEGGGDLLVTVHPSYVLRLPDARLQAEEFARLATDLRLARPYLTAEARAEEAAA